MAYNVSPQRQKTEFVLFDFAATLSENIDVMVAVGRQGAIDPEVQWKHLEDSDSSRCQSDISQTEMASAATCRWLGCC